MTASLLPVLALLPFFGAAVVLGVSNERRGTAAWLAGAVALAGVAILAICAPAVFSGEVLRWRVDWLPQVGLGLGFRMDGLAFMFAGLICGIGALIVLYAAYYLHHDDPAARFFTFLLLFMGAMLGIVLADNLIVLVVFWELTSLSSFLLIGYWSHRNDAREGAKMALAITGAGGLALLAGVLIIGQIVGSMQLDDVLAAGDRIRAHPLYVPALVLVLAGCFTKSAQFPFHFWLPHAMAAPTPVSAYLHSATMVKAGVFLLARMYPALGDSEAWFWIVSCTGLTTLLVGAYIAIFQHDLKGLLAYSTISHLGLITLLFGLDHGLAVVAGVFHILNHATFKASLFMAAGIIDHESGSRDMRKLNGLWRYMPVTGALAVVASAAMAGVPLLNGFLSKEMFFGAALQLPRGDWFHVVLPAVATLAATFSVAYSARFVYDVFFNGQPKGLGRTPHEPPRFMRVPVELLVVLCVVVGIAPAFVVGDLLAVAGRAALHGGPQGELPVYSLAIWHGFNLPLLMSAVALAGGLALYFGLQKFVDLHRIERLPGWIRRGGREFFGSTAQFAVLVARDFTAALGNGSLQRYLFLLVLAALAAGLVPYLWGGAGWPAAAGPGTPAAAPFVILWAIGIAAAFATTFAYRRRLLALLFLGVVGLLVGLCFVFLSAPDLALTQILVEVVTIILMMLALAWLPEESQSEPGRARAIAHGVLAGAAGLGVAGLAYAAMTRPFDSISPYFLGTTLPEGGGANAVNVIIVDYRGFDTLGEITVLGMAGVIIFALLAGFRPVVSATSTAERHPLLLALISRLLLPLAALVSLHLFLRGHNLPGGGFIAGLVLAIALILVFVANGQRWVAVRVGTDYRGWIAWGLLIAGLTGVASWAFGAPFLTSTYLYLPIPVFGPLPLASASLFDLGVFLTVVGATMVALVSIGRISGRDEPGVPEAVRTPGAAGPEAAR